jgi:hypothetical protein
MAAAWWQAIAAILVLGCSTMGQNVSTSQWTPGRPEELVALLRAPPPGVHTLSIHLPEGLLNTTGVNVSAYPLLLAGAKPRVVSIQGQPGQPPRTILDTAGKSEATVSVCGSHETVHGCM